MIQIIFKINLQILLFKFLYEKKKNKKNYQDINLYYIYFIVKLFFLCF